MSPERDGQAIGVLVAEERIMKPIINCLDLIFTSPLLFYRLFRYGYTFRRIYLGQGKWTILDVEDYYKFADIGWALSGCERNLYAIGGIKNKNGEFELVRLHRAIMNPPQKLVVDHRNSDGLDNRRENLRIATKSQNAFNCRKRKNTSSQFYGVYFRKSTGKWVACVWYRKKKISLGNFEKEIEAARAYDRAAIKYRKEFARLNFPEERTQRAAGSV